MAVPAGGSIVTLGVSDLTRSTEFYRSLGWELEKSSNDEISRFKTAGAILALFPYEALAEDAALSVDRREGFGGVTLAINVANPEEVQPIFDQVEAAGGKILKPATRASWGGTSGYFADPDGHPWEVAWAPGFRFSPEGSVLFT